MVEQTIVEKFISHGRWQVRLSGVLFGRSVWPQANYVWLKENPAFVDIPRGYVIHHLDNDPLNDDISNLALMQKHHHTAHHWKQRHVKTERIDIRIVENRSFVPCAEPRVGFRKCRGRKSDAWFVEIPESINGTVKRSRVSFFRGERLESKEMAEKMKALIWDNYSVSSVSPVENGKAVTVNAC